MLSSIGMNRKQKINMLLKEALIIGSIGIAIGIVISILISFGLIDYLASVASRYNSENIYGAFLQLDYRVELKTVIPLAGIGITVVLAYLIVILSCIFPIRKLSKISTIDAIRETKGDKLKAKMMKTPKIIGKLFKQEGELAYKNIRKDKSKYRTVVVTIACSIVLFLAITQVYDISTYRYGRRRAKNTNQMNASIYIEKQNGNQGEEETMKYLLDNKFTDRCISVKQINAFNEKASRSIKFAISFPKTKLTEKGKRLYEDKEIALKEEKDNYLAEIPVYIISGTVYDEVLEELKLDKLDKDECIIMDTMRGSKSWENIKVSSIEKGEKILIKEVFSDNGYYQTENDSEASKEEREMLDNLVKDLGGDITPELNKQEEISTEEIKLESHELTVKAIYDKYIPNVYAMNSSPFVAIVSEETKEEWIKGENAKMIGLTEVDFYTDDGKKVEESMDELNSILEKIDAKATWSQEYQFSVARESSDKFQDTIVYSFLTMIVLLLSVNVFSIIWSGITLRKKEFASLKSMGMSNKQIIKMLILECVFYGIDAFIYGSLISVLILFVMYLKLVQRNYYAFYIPWKDIAFSGIVMYVIIFLAMFTKIKQIFKQNIIDSIKDENV